MGRQMSFARPRRRDLFEQLRGAESRPLYRVARLWQVVWGLPQTAIGSCMFFLLRHTNRWARYRSAYVMEWKLDSGLSMGMFIFVPRDTPRSLLVHEYGHTLQSLLLGPLFLPVVVLPSLVWAGLPQARRYRARKNFSYYRFPVERWANRLSHRVTGETPVGWY